MASRALNAWQTAQLRISSSGAWRAMRHRNFRLFWTGYLISNAGAWIQSLAQAWLVLEISDNAAWVGAVGFVRAFPLIFFALIGGSLADRIPRRKILITTQMIMCTNALILGALTYMGVVQIWHVLVVAMISATAQAFEQPARQSMIPSLVTKDDLHTAISLNAIAFNGAAVLGPSLVGVLYPIVGLAGCFFINAVSYLAVFYALHHMEFPAPSQRQRKSMFGDVKEGLSYVWAQPVVLALIMMAAVNSFAARPYQQFISVFAKDVFHSEIGLAGLMQSAPALGTVIFMLAVTAMGNIQWKGKMLLASGLIFSLSLLAFAWAPHPLVAIPLLVIVGGTNMTWQTTLNTLLQSNTPEEMRGRVMSTYTITAMAMMPLGQGPMGYAVQQIGPQRALTVGAVVALLFIIYMGIVRVKAVRQLP